MKLERISENQIRCTLNISDLDSRQIKLSELAYGSGKTREFFRDMMQQAAVELGFEVDDIPLMIEAIPSHESITLIITKVENPDEFERLDKRITKMLGTEPPETIEDSLDFDELDYDDIEDTHEPSDETPADSQHKGGVKYCTYSFDSLSRIIKLAKVIPKDFDLENALYKSPENGRYYLVFCGTQEESKEYYKLIDLLSEFGNKEPAMYATDSYYLEHFEHIVICDALQHLSMI